MINKLREKLLNASIHNGDVLIRETIEAIHSTMECDMCTLWSINHNNTISNREKSSFNSASLIVRCLKEGIKYSTYQREDYAHPLPGSFIEKVLTLTVTKNASYYDCPINDDMCEYHKSISTLKDMGLLYLISIPIWKDERNNTLAFVKLAYKKNPNFDSSVISVIANDINKAVASALTRYQLYQQQQILNDLMQSYKQGKNSLKDIFYPVIHTIFRKYFDYEGASVFIWDSFDNRFNLLSTTGLLPYYGDIFYEIGEGLTGKAAEEKVEKIYDDIVFLEEEKIPPHIHKYREKTQKRGETMLVVPILRTSKSEEVLGIIRFTNKINKQSIRGKEHQLDYFNDNDIELIRNAFHYFALNIEYFQAEDERKGFISKMSHEFKAPASAIRTTAERALRKFRMNDTHFMRLIFEHYMQSIIDYADLQIMQATSNLFLTKLRNKNYKFKISTYSIFDIIKESINIIRPIARDHNARFDNIQIAASFPKILVSVDKEAFIMVFYNLLTNAIKYQSDNFDVLFSAEDTPEGLIIFVSDWGIGISEADTSKLFHLGVRSENARKMNAEGYGVGLHVVKLIIDAFGGEIRVSHPQKPTTVEIKLPRKLYI